ncbi:hypothetical protein LJ737_20690 [Hymenobacter sp. 15J16-1T3B]|uniref:hypothetical protein n=1 Tax=Hymenobacter sp. 15J16-1T3B TaxID=2886941 RepID=UPI001D10D979|nr:hypothetical protein [Hymenobacter sp. 15J16-1T3B]MCC3159671.1 hypothetical protein [Hymenobacter sp. 15J16-1T3B]
MAQITRPQFISLIVQLLETPAAWPIDFRDVGTLLRNAADSAFFKLDDQIPQSSVIGLIARLNRLELNAGGAASETAGIQVFEDLQADPGVVLVKQGDNVIATLGTEGRRFQAKRDLTRSAGFFPVPTGLAADLNWKELPIGGRGYNPLVSGGYAAIKDLADNERLQTGKFYTIFRDNGEPDVFVQATSATTLGSYAVEDPTGANTPGYYDLATDSFSKLDFSRVAAVRVTLPGEEAAGYGDLAAAADGATAAFGGLDECTLLVADGQFIGSNVYLDNAAALVGLQTGIVVLAGATLRLPTSETQGVYISGGGGSGTVVLQGTIRNSRLLSAAQTVTTSCRVYNSELGLTTVASGATLTIGAGCILPPSFFAGMTVQGQHTYTTPQGGTVSDERGGGEDFVPIAENQYSTHPAFTSQAALNAYLLGGTYSPPPPAPTGLTVTGRTAEFDLAAGKSAADYEYQFTPTP